MRIGLIGKYVNLPDAYLSVVEALRHGGFAHGATDRPRVDPGRGGRGAARRRPAAGPRRDRHPGRVRRAGHRGQDRGRRLRPGARDPVPRAVPRPAGDGRSSSPATWPAWPAPTRASSTRPRPHPVIDLMDEQRDVVDMGGTMRLGRLPGQAGARLAGGRRRTATSWSTSATATATRSTPATGSRLEDGRPGLLGHVARRPAGRVHRAAGPPVLGRHPGPPGVQEPAGPTPTRCSRRSSRPPWQRAEGRAPRLLDIDGLAAVP